VSALLCRKLRRVCSDADPYHPIHPSFRQAVDALRGTRIATITN
jgi:hypothetical protein